GDGPGEGPGVGGGRGDRRAAGSADSRPRRPDSLCLGTSLSGKPVPTFPGRALVRARPCPENRYPLFRDVLRFENVPVRKTGTHFSGTCSGSSTSLSGKPEHALAGPSARYG